MKGKNVRRLFFTCALLLLAFFTAPGGARAEDALAVSMPEVVRGYEACEIRLVSPGEGEAELRLFDLKKNPWLSMIKKVTAGENVIAWDGLGVNGERLMSGPYHFDITVRLEDGQELKITRKFEIYGSIPTLVYAIPSSDTLYLDHSERWFVECYVTVACGVVMEVRDGQGQLVIEKSMFLDKPEGDMFRWAGTLISGGTVAPGQYTVTCRGRENPDDAKTFPLTVAETNPLSREVKPTGPVLPERGMSDEEVWAIMMKPSVVIDANGSSRRFELKSQPRSSSRAAASLRCALQGLEVLDTEGAWAHVVAWDHSDGHRAEGYYLLKKLTVYAPNPHYGVLVDKRDQTLTLYEEGKKVAVVPVSTGLVVGRDKYRETPAGAFLTDVRLGADFAQDGFRYEYPLRYDGGNILHSVGYAREGRVRDYSENLPLLGQKASHGCVRVSPFVEEGGFLNMYWLWTHLPYHTRVIILDD